MIGLMDFLSRLRTMRLLLVDDDDWIRDALGTFFQLEGCDIVALPTAEEGMSACDESRFDIVISDYRLSGRDGLSFLAHVARQTPPPITVLITAFGSSELVDEAERIGIDVVIEKPFQLDDLEVCLAPVMMIRELEG